MPEKRINLRVSEKDITVLRRYCKLNGVTSEGTALGKIFRESDFYKSNENNFLGQFGKVSLTSLEIQKLEQRLGPVQSDIMIQKLDTYIESTGREYNNHYATILMWAEKDKEKIEKERLANEPLDLDALA